MIRYPGLKRNHGGQEAADVFSVPDFWRGPRWLDASLPEHSEFFKPVAGATQDLHFLTTSQDAVNAESQEFFAVPEALASLAPKHVVQEECFNHVEPTASSQRPRRESISLFDDASMGMEEAALSTAEFLSWDRFAMPDIPPAEPRFITEAGPDAYDAALDSPDDPFRLGNGNCNVVETHPYLAALLALAMGRTSIFFKWNEESASFVEDLDRLRISGFSRQVLQGLQTRCLQCGNTSRFLDIFVQTTYRTRPSAGRVAMAKTVDTLLLAVQTQVGVQARKVGSLLQLQSVVHPIHIVLAYFNNLVTKLNKTRSDEQILSLLFEEAQAMEHSNSLLTEIMQEVLARVSEPWLEFVEQWIGVTAEEGNPLTKDGPGKSFVRVEDVAYLDDFGIENEQREYVLDARRIPSFLSEDIAQTMFEVGKNLRLLRTHHAEHPLCHTGAVLSRNPPRLDWHYSWSPIRELQRRVSEYETTTLRAIHHHESGLGSHVQPQQSLSHTGYELQLFGQEQNQLAEHLMAAAKKLDQPPPVAGNTDRLSRILHDRLFDGANAAQSHDLELSPHWSLLPLLCLGPLIETQARLTNREYMKLLFASHQLRDHILIQKDFQLLGNGVFCDRLSHALFDSDLETAERRSGVARSGGVMGLRLGSRDTWPPASSELRLALMGVLTESYDPGAKQPSWGIAQPTLPGDLSFAVRDLSEEEIERCMNPGSLEALDFLRLSYKTPPQLAPIITPMVLVKYDKIFKHLLRMLRMLYVVGELHRDVIGRTSRWHDISDTGLRFRIEAQHFVTRITAYFFDTGIAVPWRRFESWLTEVQADLGNDDLADHGSAVVSPDNVRQRHERALDSIIHTLLLRKRQQPILKVLEDIFNTILKFSKLARLEATGKFEAGHAAVIVADLYKTFKNKVAVFLTVCRGLSDRGSRSRKGNNISVSGENDGTGAMDESSIDRLLLQLEMSGYYNKSGYEHM